MYQKSITKIAKISHEYYTNSKGLSAYIKSSLSGFKMGTE